MPHDLTIVIPAAGLGRRMKSYGPKALIEVGSGQTVLGRQLAVLGRVFPGADIVVVVGFEAERVVRHLPGGVRVVENECYEATNVARSLEIGLRSSACKAALFVYGDLVFNAATFEGLPRDRSSVLVDQAGWFRDGEVGCNVVDGLAAHFDYGLATKWAQVALLTGRELALFRRLAAGRDKRRHFGYEILNDVLEHDGELAAVRPPKMHIVEIDTSRDIGPARAVPA
jgi:hypothetical protein